MTTKKATKPVKKKIEERALEQEETRKALDESNKGLFEVKKKSSEMAGLLEAHQKV